LPPINDQNIEDELKKLLSGLASHKPAISWYSYIASGLIGGVLFFLEFTSPYLAIYGSFIPVLIFLAMDRLMLGIYDSRVILTNLKMQELISQYDGGDERLMAIIDTQKTLIKSGLK
jgi:hypothetical protein